jgi:hypothetical protein
VRKSYGKALAPFDLQLFGSSGSGAGANWVLVPILRLNPSATAVSSPLTGYGTIGVNDSGLVLMEAKNFTKWGFQMCPEESPAGTVLVTGYSVTIYYTISRFVLFAQQTRGTQPLETPADATGSTLVPVGSWWPLPAAADQSGTGTDYNPLTSDGPVLSGSRFALGFRAVLTTIGSPSGGCIIYGGGVP